MKHSNKNILTDLFLSKLLSTWQLAGNEIGVDIHLNLQKLLDTLPDNIEPHELKTFIAPLFVSSAQSQEEFYGIFEEVYNDSIYSLQQHQNHLTKVKEKTAQEYARDAFLRKVKRSKVYLFFEKIKNKLPIYRWRQLGWGLLFLSLCGAAWKWYEYKNRPPITETTLKNQQVFVPINFLSESKRFDFCLSFKDEKKIKINRLERISDQFEHIEISEEFQDENICFYGEAKSLGRDFIQYQYCLDETECYNLNLIFRIENFKDFYPKRSLSTGKAAFNYITPSKGSPRAQYKEAPSETTISTPVAVKMDSMTNLMAESYQMNQASRPARGVTSTINFGNGLAYFDLTKVLILAGTILFFLFVNWRIKRKRERYALEQNVDDTLPKKWSIKIPYIPQVDLGTEFKKTLSAMSGRTFSDVVELDIASTVHESIKSGGAINFQYEQLTETKDFLVLIDNPKRMDLKSKIFELFIENLKKNDTPITSFYFDKNIDVCKNAKNKKGLSFSQVCHNYQSSQLIIFSDGYQFLKTQNEIRTKIKETAKAWNKRVLMTSKPLPEWGEKEKSLGKFFRLIPATPKGFTHVVDILDETDPKPYQLLASNDELSANKNDLEFPESLSGEELIKRLEDEFLLKEDDRDNPILMKWLAACALPTEIFKDWVFFVGQILSPPHRKILSAENLQKFARLPWFRTGKMSETVRYTLISYLEKKHPNWYHTIQHEWYYVLNLEENLPPVGSIAWKGHRVQIILNELLQKPNRYDRADLEYELEELIKNDEEQDALVVKYEESTKGPLDSVLSSRFRKLIQKEERFRWRWRAWTWQLPVFTMMFLGATLIHSSETVTTFKFDDHISKLVFAPDLKQFLVGNGNFDLAVCFVSGGYKMGTKGKGKIVGLEYSEDGNSILSATTQNHQIFWDVSGVPIFSGGGENEVINAVDFHPENQFLAIKAFASGKAELWDLNKNILRASFPHNDNVYDVAFSPDGSQILTASRDHSAKLWDLSGNLLAEFSHDWFVYSVDFSPDGKYIATGCKDNTARIWSVSGALLHELKGHSYDVFDVEFSPSGKTLVSTTKRDVFLWNVSDGNWQRTFRGHNDFVKTAAFSPNGKLLLTGDASGIVKMWRLGIEK